MLSFDIHEIGTELRRIAKETQDAAGRILNQPGSNEAQRKKPLNAHTRLLMIEKRLFQLVERVP